MRITSHDQRGIVRATVTEGEIIVRNDPDADLSGLNRDIDRAREITKNEKAKMDVYVSKQAIEEILNKGEGIVENIESLAARFNAFLPSQDTPETSEGQGPAKQGDAQWAEESREYAQNLKVTGDNLKVLHDTIIEHGGTEADVKEAFTAMADAGAIAKEIDITVAEYGSHSAIPLEKAQLLLQKSVQSLKAMKDVFTRLNVDSIPPLYGEHSTALPPQQTTADVLWQSSVQSGRQAIGAAYETVRFMKGFSDKMGEGVWTATTSSLRYVQGSIHQTLSIESPAKQFADNVDSAIVRAVWEHPEKTFDISNNVQAAFWQADTAMRKAKGGYETGRAAWDLAMSMAAMFAPEFALRSPGAVGAAAGKAGSQAGKAAGAAAQTGKTVGNAVSGAGKAGSTGRGAEFGKDTAKGTHGMSEEVISIPGRVQSRINIPDKDFGHALKRHMNPKVNASQFSISEKELRTLLADKKVVHSQVRIAPGSGNFYRTVDIGRIIGTDKLQNFTPTSKLTVITDKYGNLKTAHPGSFGGQ